MNVGNSSREANYAKWGLRFTFFFLGMSVSVATARLAEIKAHTHSSDSLFGFAVLIGNFGIMAGNFLGGVGVHKLGSKSVIRIAILGIAFSQVGYGFANHLWQISTISFLAGLFGSFSNVGVNMQGGMIESHIGRSLMPVFHGSWTLGAFSASLLASIVTPYISLKSHLLANAIFTFLAVSCSALLLFPKKIDEETLSLPENSVDENSTSKRLHPLLLLIAVTAALSILSESSVGDWSSIFLHEKFNISISLAALGYTVFALGQIIGRFTVGRRIDKLGITTVVRTGGFLGGLMYFAAPWLVRLLHLKAHQVLIVMCVSYFFIGLCIAPMPPAFAILAFKVPNFSAAKAIAQMQVISAFAFMLFRLIMSGLTNLVGLQNALMFPAITLILTGWLASAIASRHKTV
jgi:MFS family permease